MGLMAAAEVATESGLSEDELWAKVRSGEFPAPDRLYGSRRTPMWDAATVADPQPRVPTSAAQKLTRDQQMMHLYDELVVWALEHGDTDVPQGAVGRVMPGGKRFPLGARVSALRYLKSLGDKKQLKNPSDALTAAERRRFESLPGWAWDHFDNQWRRRLASVLSRWPHKLTTQDRKWVSSQRGRWDVLRPEWRELLTAVPGLIEPLERSKVDLFVQAASEWLAANPGKTLTDVTFNTEIVLESGEIVRLGRRMTYYRRRYRGLEGKGKNPLPAHEVAKIEALPGWTWGTAGSTT